MPTSRPTALGFVCDQFIARQPKSVLDIGIGFGKFGFLAREYTDVWSGRYFNPETKVDGIEVFEPYITELQKLIYNHIYIGEALDVLEGLGRQIYDMAVCSDMLEHVTKVHGLRIIGEAKRVSRYSVIVIPAYPGPQGSVYGNEHERHVSRWVAADLIKLGRLTLLDEKVFALELEEKGGP